MQLKINCHCVTIFLSLNNNKLAPNDQTKCFVINACIFLFSTMILTACQFSLYNLGLNNIISDHFLLYQSNNIILPEYIVYCIDVTTDNV